MESVPVPNTHPGQIDTTAAPSQNIHIGLVYEEFELFLRNFKLEVEDDLARQLGYSGESLRERLAQRVVELVLIPYVLNVQNRVDRLQAPYFPKGESFILAGLEFDSTTGRVRPTVAMVLRALAEFLKYSAVLFWFSALSPRDRECQSDGDITLALGISRDSLFRNSTDGTFASYCREGPIQPLCTAAKIIVESAKESASASPHITYRKRPIISLLASVKLPWRAKVQMLIAQLQNCRRIFGLAIKRSPIIALAKDLAFCEPLLTAAKHSRLQHLLYTNTNYLEQPLWTRPNPRRSFAVHMAWYSQNIVPVVFKADSLQGHIPNYRHLRVDDHWIWTETLGRYLESLGVPGAMHVVGPILWYFPEPAVRPLPENDGVITIACFDVTPLTDEFARKIGLIGNYYSTRNLKMFLEGVSQLGTHLAITHGRAVQIALKHKRGHGAHHDPDYSDLIEHLKRNGSILRILPPETNIYSLVQECDLVIVPPYSSPAYIAAMHGAPAIFYDPTESLLPTHDAVEHLYFASGIAELYHLANSLLRERIPVVPKSPPPK